jgi:NADP-dependent 3-hydroxy acid dehydrogenase YdfG
MPIPSPVKTFHKDTYPAIHPTSPHLSTKGKNVAITGGGSGVGKAIAHSFATSGSSSITLLGRTEKTLLETKAELNKDFPNTKFFIIVTDIVDRNSVNAAFEAIKSNIGTVDILIANAGVMPAWNTIAESDPEEWYRGFDVNVKGNMNLVQAFLPLAAANATVINISAGMAHLQYYPVRSAYHASKLAAIKIFDYLHHENPQLFVLNVHPGVLMTGLGGDAVRTNTHAFDTCEFPQVANP